MAGVESSKSVSIKLKEIKSFSPPLVTRELNVNKKNVIYPGYHLIKFSCWMMPSRSNRFESRNIFISYFIAFVGLF